MSVATKVALGDVVRLARASAKPEDIDPERQYVLLEHIVAGTGEVSPVLAGSSDIRSAKASFQAGDVLYGKLRPKLRKVCVVADDGYCSTDILPLRPVHPHSSYYLASILRSERFYLEVERLVAGANLPRVNAKELLKLEVPWLEDDDERRKLDELARIAAELRSEVSVMGQRIESFERALWVS
jgi:type I restriction enzyme S subunit